MLFIYRIFYTVYLFSRVLAIGCIILTRPFAALLLQMATLIPWCRNKAIQNHGSIENAIAEGMRKSKISFKDVSIGTRKAFNILWMIICIDMILWVSLVFDLHFVYDLFIYSPLLALALCILFSEILPVRLFDEEIREKYFSEFERCSKRENRIWTVGCSVFIALSLLSGYVMMYIMFNLMRDRRSSYEAVNIFFHQLL